MRPHEDGNYSLEEQHGAMTDAIEWPPEAREALLAALRAADMRSMRQRTNYEKVDDALAALAPVVAQIKAAEFKRGAEAMRESAAVAVQPKGKRPCDCERWRCDCGNSGNLIAVEGWDNDNDTANAIRALPIPEDKQP